MIDGKLDIFMYKSKWRNKKKIACEIDAHTVFTQTTVKAKFFGSSIHVTNHRHLLSSPDLLIIMWDNLNGIFGIQ